MVAVYDEWDTGTAWLIMVDAFLLQVLVAGSFTTFGILMVEYIEQFSATKVTASWIGAVLFCLSGLSGLIFGPLVEKFGFRAVCITSSVLAALGYIASAFVNEIYWLYLTHGLMGAIGVGAWGVCANTSNQLYFRKHRGLANAVAMSGLSVGVFFWSFVTQKLVEVYSWRGAIMLMGAIKLHGIPLGMLLRKPKHRPEPELENQEPASANPAADTNTTTFDANHDDVHGDVYINSGRGPPSNAAAPATPKESLRATYKYILSDKPFVIYILVTFLTFLAHYMPHTFLPLRAVSLGISKQKVAFVISILGLVGGVGRVIFGWISDLPRVHRMLMYAVTSILTGVATTLATAAKTFAEIAVYCTVYSILSAVYCSVMFRLVSDLVGLERLATAIGFIFAAMGSSLLICTPVGGLLIDTTGDTGLPFLVFGFIQILGGGLSLVIVWYNRRYRPHLRYSGPNGDLGVKT